MSKPSNVKWSPRLGAEIELKQLGTIRGNPIYIDEEETDDAVNDLPTEDLSQDKGHEEAQ